MNTSSQKPFSAYMADATKSFITECLRGGEISDQAMVGILVSANIDKIQRRAEGIQHRDSVLWKIETTH